MNLGGCSALVTGGGSGLGRATALALAAAGAHVVVLDLPGAGADAGAGAGADASSIDLEDRPPLHRVDGDVLDESAVSEAVRRAGELGDLRVVVTCAGVATPGRTVTRDGRPADLASFDRVVRINTVGTYNVLRLAAAAMVTNDEVDGERGVVIMTSSVAAFDGQIGQAAYAASKGAVAAMTLPLAREFAASLIRVVSIAPGVFDTPLLAGLPEAARSSLEAQVPHPSRLGRPEEFASLVRHICENPMLNGETIRLDGAIRMPPR